MFAGPIRLCVARRGAGRLVVPVVGLTVLAMLAAGALADPVPAAAAAAAATAAVSKSVPVPVDVVSKPDQVSAMLAAHRLGHEVEISGLTSATSMTWAQPDGSLKTEMDQAPVRVERAGAWVDVDTTLAAAGGRVTPAAAVEAYTFSGGGSGPLVAWSNTAGQALSLSWPAVLPVPTLSGDTATYPGVLPGTDLLLSARRAGWEISLRLNTRPTKPVSVSLPLSLTGLRSAQRADGSFGLLDGAGKAVVNSPLGQMWDATGDPTTGRALHTAAVTSSLTSTSLTLSPAQSFMADPGTVFPVTVDPLMTMADTSDAYVNKATPTTAYYQPSALKTGFDGTNTFRSFLFFHDWAGMRGKHILNAYLQLWNSYSSTCAANSSNEQVDVYTLGSAWTYLTTWNTKPSLAIKQGSAIFAHGRTGCAADYHHITITGAVAKWADYTDSTGMLGVVSTSETSTLGYKNFYSAQTGLGGVPKIYVTYNSYPSVPTSFSPFNGQSWGGLTPMLSAVVADPDGGYVQGKFFLQDVTAGNSWVGPSTGSYGNTVTSGQRSAFTTSTLTNGHTYRFQVESSDTVPDVSAASAWTSFLIDTTAPNPPTVSSTTWTAGSWTPATSGTINWSDTSPDVTSYSWKLDAGTWSAFTSATSQAISGLARNQEHTVSVQGKTTSGQISATTDFTFGVGVQCSTSGSRVASQPLAHQLNDSTAMSLNPTNGNLTLSGSLLRLRGVGQDLNIGWRHNGLNDSRPTLNVGLAETALTPWSDGSFSYVAPDGGCYTFAKTGSIWSNPAGINATIVSAVAGTVKLRFNPSGIINTYVLTSGAYQLNTSADKNSPPATPNLITYTYVAGQLTNINDTQNRNVTFAYTDVNNPAQPSAITDTSLSRTINLAYGGPSGALSQITDAAGAISTLEYDSTGLISLTNNGNQTSFEYDSNQRLVNWTFGDGTPEASNWAASYGTTTTTTITDPNSNAAVYTIAGSRTTNITDPLGHGATSVWDSHDNLTSRTDAMSNLTSNTYGNGPNNPNNLLAKIISPAGTTGGTGTTRQLTFPTTATGALGDYQPNGTIDAQNNTSTIGYDTNTGQANTVTSHSAAGVAIGGTKTSTIQGDAAGTNCAAKTGEVCTTKNGNNNTTTYGYDTDGNPTSITPPAPLLPRAFTYDSGGRVLTGTDGRGNTARYTYDSNDRITQVSYAATGCPAATCVAYTYDDAGNLTSRTSPTGLTVIGYDALNRPTTKTQAGVLVSTATYDPASNLTSYTDTNGTIGYGYDTANRLVSLAEPGGSCPAYPTTAATPNATACTVFRWTGPTGLENANQRTAVRYPTGQVTTSVYDNANRALSITAKTSAGATLTSRAYTYQSAAVGGADQALRATMTDQSGTTSYGYDGLNRLTSANTSGWGYDNDGNRTTATKTGTPTIYSAYNGADQLCWTSTTSGSTCASPPTGATTYTYDTTGNQTTDQAAGPTLANSFNVFNQLTDTLIGGTTTLTSTYADTSNTERLTAGATSFLNGTLGITSQTTSGTAISYIRDPYGNLVAMRTAGQSYYYTSDAQGSVIALTDSTQALAATYTYDAWGNTTGTGSLATTNPWTYATGYTDTATGYLKLGARYYNPTTGRFTQPDPSGQEPNTYNYASCNPTNNTDPTGRFGGCGNEWFQFGAGFVGFAVGVFTAPTVIGIGALIIGGSATIDGGLGIIADGCL